MNKLSNLVIIMMSLIMFLPIVLFGEFIDGNITITNVKNGDTEMFSLSTEIGEETKFDGSLLNIKDFEDNSRIDFNYSFIDFSGVIVGDIISSIEYNSNELVNSSSLSSTLSFNLSNIYTTMPVSSESTNSFKIKFFSTYDDPNEIGVDKVEDIEFTFYYDTVIPEKPIDFELVPGDKSISVKWDNADDTDTKDYDEYVIYYQEVSDIDFTELRVSGVNRSTRIEGLENDVEYIVYMIAVDSAGNESEATEQLTISPIPVDDFYKYYKKSGGSEDGGYCFIATAAYGSYDNGMVKILRSFRDGYLPDSIVNTYYKYSPPLANIIANSKVLSFVTRVILEPIVIYANFFLYASMLFKFLMLSLFSLLLLLKVKIRIGGIYNV